jgi:hypothetical protein
MMPRSALDHANHVLTLAEMTRHLRAIAGEALLAAE